jgi:nucleotide-binding universal stress UspA family protein
MTSSSYPYHQVQRSQGPIDTTGVHGERVASVVFASDGSTWAEGAFAQAAFYASLRNSRLHALTIPQVRSGNRPEDRVLEYADRVGAELIVIAKPLQLGGGRFTGRRVLEAIVANAACPVLTVGAGRNEVGLPCLKSGSILVGIDFSETSREALRQAVKFADAFSARLDLIHAVQEPFWSAGPSHVLRSVYEIEPNIEARLGDARDIFRQEATDAFPAEGPILSLSGPPDKVIVEVADRLGSSLIVLGSKGLRSLGDLVLGHVAQAVISTATRPVLTVKRPKAARAAADTIRRRRAMTERQGPVRQPKADSADYSLSA